MSKDKKSKYYDVGGIEVLSVIRAKLTPEQYQGYLLGNSIKYLLRMMHKTENPLRDAEKAALYAGWLRDSFGAVRVAKNEEQDKADFEKLRMLHAKYELRKNKHEVENIKCKKHIGSVCTGTCGKINTHDMCGKI